MLGVSDLLTEVLAVLDVKLGDCRCLPALSHMLRKGSLVRNYGEEVCAELVPLAKQIKIITDPDPIWLDRLISITSIDPGEAQLFALAAQNDFMIITGDKRALRAIKDIDGYPEALAGRIVVIEAILMVLCDRLGHAEVKRKLGTLVANNMTLRSCFSESNPDPISGLESYYRSLATEVHPLLLWEPIIGGSK